LISIPYIVQVDKVNRLNITIQEAKNELEQIRVGNKKLQEKLQEKLQKSLEQNSYTTKQLDEIFKKASTLEQQIKTLESINNRIQASKTIVSRGTKRDYIVTKKILNNSKMLNMRATAYDLSIVSCGKRPSHPEYGITRTGERVIYKTTVAVDPNTIPLGSILYIQFPEKYSYMNGIYKAMDTGSAVKGDIIDIYMGENKTSLCNKFGIQKAKVYILEK
jgi:3D (Asp-Asp-Asp) domain-containing protein